jgi:hypothetical protein
MMKNLKLTTRLPALLHCCSFCDTQCILRVHKLPIMFLWRLVPAHALSYVPSYKPREGEVLRGVRRTARPDLSALPSRGV